MDELLLKLKSALAESWSLAYKLEEAGVLDESKRISSEINTLEYRVLKIKEAKGVEPKQELCKKCNGGGFVLVQDVDSGKIAECSECEGGGLV